MHSLLRRAPVTLMGLSLLLAAGCIDRSGLGNPDGGDDTGEAGATGSGSAGTSATGVAGTTGAAGTKGTAGTTGAAGTKGTAGTTGKAGTGGTMCGPVCAIYCQFGNVLDGKGCPTCQCNPSPVCKVEECGPQPFAGNAAGSDSAGAALPAPCEKVVPPTCARDAMTGKCAWTPSTCEQCSCGELPPVDYSMKCADGTIIGPVCERSAGKCGWTFPKCPPPVACPAIACLRACPYGARVDANGCQTCDCIEPKECGALTDWKSCTADMRCTWLQPGCGTPALSTPGCFSREDVGCQGTCSNGRTCLKRVINPCYSPGGGPTCAACGFTETVCL